MYIVVVIFGGSYLQKGEGNLNVVIGDQHCDLDSMVSALARSYFNYLVSLWV